MEKWTVPKKFMNYFSKYFRLYVKLSPRDQHQSPIISFVPERSLPNIGWFQHVLERELANRVFMERGSRRIISFGFKLIFCSEKQFQYVLACSHISMVNVIYESPLKWTWHHSKLAIEVVSFYHRLKAVLLQLDILTPWSSRNEGPGGWFNINGISYTGKMTSLYWIRGLRFDPVKWYRLTSMGIPMLKIRRSRDRLIFNMGYLGKTAFILRQDPGRHALVILPQCH